MAMTTTDIETDEIFQNLIPQYEDYEPWPVEVFILSHLLTNKDTNEGTNDNLENIIKQFTATHFFTLLKQSQEKIQEFENMLKEIYTHTAEKSQQIQSLKKSALTWDLYSISILFVTLLMKLQIDIENYDFMKQYMNLLLRTIFSDPITRPPIKTIVEEIESIFRTIKKEEYKSFLNSLQQKEKLQQDDNPQLLEEAVEEVPEVLPEVLPGLAVDV
jgi:hypothetical protein